MNWQVLKKKFRRLRAASKLRITKPKKDTLIVDEYEYLQEKATIFGDLQEKMLNL